MIKAPKKMQIQNSDKSDFSLTLIDIIFILSKNLRFIIIFVIITITLTIVYLFNFTVPMYQSSSKLISSQESESSGLSGLASQFGFNTNATSSFQWTHPEIVKSRKVARSMLKRMFYSETYGKEMSLLKILNGEQANENSSLYSLEMEAIDKFLNMVTFYVDSKSKIYTLIITGREPNLVAKINQALIEELDLQQSIYARQKTSESRKFIQERIVEVGNELSKKRRKFKRI